MPRLDGHDLMAWGQYKGRRLDSIPEEYWQWCLEQEWFREQYDLCQYARRVVPPDLSWEEAIRMLRRMR